MTQIHNMEYFLEWCRYGGHGPFRLLAGADREPCAWDMAATDDHDDLVLWAAPVLSPSAGFSPLRPVGAYIRAEDRLVGTSDPLEDIGGWIGDKVFSQMVRREIVSMADTVSVSGWEMALPDSMDKAEAACHEQRLKTLLADWLVSGLALIPWLRREVGRYAAQSHCSGIRMLDVIRNPQREAARVAESAVARAVRDLPLALNATDVSLRMLMHRAGGRLAAGTDIRRILETVLPDAPPRLHGDFRNDLIRRVQLARQVWSLQGPVAITFSSGTGDDRMSGTAEDFLRQDLERLLAGHPVYPDCFRELTAHGHAGYIELRWPDVQRLAVGDLILLEQEAA